MNWTRTGTMTTCKNCGHDVSVHHAQPIGCGTPVRCATEPYRRVQCPCPRFEYGQPTSMPLPPLPPPPDPVPVPEDEPELASRFREYLAMLVRG